MRAATRDTRAATRDAPVAIRDAAAAIRDMRGAIRDARAATRDTRAAIRDGHGAIRDARAVIKDTRAVIKDARAATRDVVEDAPFVSAAASRSRKKPRIGRAARPLAPPTVRLVIRTVVGIHTYHSHPRCELLVEMGRGGRGSLD